MKVNIWITLFYLQTETKHVLRSEKVIWKLRCIVEIVMKTTMLGLSLQGICSLELFSLVMKMICCLPWFTRKLLSHRLFTTVFIGMKKVVITNNVLLKSRPIRYWYSQRRVILQQLLLYHMPWKWWFIRNFTVIWVRCPRTNWSLDKNQFAMTQLLQLLHLIFFATTFLNLWCNETSFVTSY